MKKIFLLFSIALLSLNLVFSRDMNDEAAETFLIVEGTPICLSFEYYRVRDGWTPLVLSLGELNRLLWMDAANRVSELRETGTHFVEPVCFSDVSTHSLGKETSTLYFDVYEQNHVRTRWKLSPGRTAGTKESKYSDKKLK